MKIVTWNINGINRRLDNLLGWLAAAEADVVCLQELKSTDGDFPRYAIAEAGYEAVWHGQKTWNGVAILSRVGKPLVSRRSLPGDDGDKQARYLEAAVQGVLVGCLYLPNGNPQPGPKFDYKLRWQDRLADHAESLLASGLPVVLAGDFNVVPTDADIYAVRSWRRDALLHPLARARYAALLDSGWIDALRSAHPDDPPYTFWSYLREAWPRDAGLRIDHLLLSPVLAPQLASAGVDRDVRREPDASDHAPVWITLQSFSRRRRKEAKSAA